MDDLKLIEDCEARCRTSDTPIVPMYLQPLAELARRQRRQIEELQAQKKGGDAS